MRPLSLFNNKPLFSPIFPVGASHPLIFFYGCKETLAPLVPPLLRTPVDYEKKIYSILLGISSIVKEADRSPALY